MIKVLGVVCISILIVMKEIPPLKKEKKKRNLDFLHFSNHCDYSIKFSVIKIPSPLELIRVVYQPISDALYNFLS